MNRRASCIPLGLLGCVVEYLNKMIVRMMIYQILETPEICIKDIKA